VNTLVCIPIQVDDIDAALADANQAKLLGADIIELRIDTYFPGCEGDEEDAFRLGQLQKLLADCPLPVILTCRRAQEGGDYDGDEADRVSILQKLCIESEHPPAYLDFELASYQKSKNIRQKINLCVDHPKQERVVRTRLILSMHDFDGRPANLMRRLADAWAEPAATVVKFAFRARSIRDNLEIFEILREAPKPTIGLGMGEFGLMSRVLAPKFGGFLTFASLRDEAATAPGQPTIADLLGMYRFRSIGKDTKLYGVIGWPVTQSMSPLIHNAGFEARGIDAVYLPMPVASSEDLEVSYHSFRSTFEMLATDNEWRLNSFCFHGCSVTIPHKQNLARMVIDLDAESGPAAIIGALNTFCVDWDELTDEAIPVDQASEFHGDGYGGYGCNTDSLAIASLLRATLRGLATKKVCVVGSGGVSRAAVHACLSESANVWVTGRTASHVDWLVDSFQRMTNDGWEAKIQSVTMTELLDVVAQAYINCTPVGMTGGPDPDGLSIPIHELFGKLPPETVFFDTVYNPIETPMIKAAKHYGFRTIDGVEMFVKQAAAQFELWTGEQAPTQLFDRLVREKLS